MTEATPQQGTRQSPEEIERLAATLKPAQRRVLAELAARGGDGLTRAEYERIGLVSRSQAAYDLAELVQMGLLERIGAGRATHYRRAHPGAGRKRAWTDERIRTELEAFCAGRPDWPRAHDFKAEGRGDLYLAASRYGGIEHWAAELGYKVVAERSGGAPPRRRRRATRRLASDAIRPAVAAAAGLALALAATLALATDTADRSGSRATPTTAPRAASSPQRPPAARSSATASAVASRSRGPVLLTLRAVRGSSSVTVRLGSARGRILFAGTLARGTTARLRGARLWLRLGSPWNLDARIGSRALELRGARIGIVTSRGLRMIARVERPRPAPRPRAATPPSPPPAPGTVGPTVLAASASTAAAPPPPPAPPASPPPPPPTSASPSPDQPPASGSAPGPDPPPGR